MILKRTILVIAIILIVTGISAGLLILGISKGKNDNVDIYSDSVNENIELNNKDSIYNNDSKENSAESEKIENKVIEQAKSDESSNKNSNVIQKQTTNISNNVNSNNSTPITNNNINTNTNNNNKSNSSNTTDKNKSESSKNSTGNIVTPKEDIYTFKRNDLEIQNMINIAKRLIKENKDNRYSGLVDCVDNIDFVIEKSGDVFYPLFDYRIENIVIDNYYPEFYVYAEDIYKNGEYLRTEYYFQ